MVQADVFEDGSVEVESVEELKDVFKELEELMEEDGRTSREKMAEVYRYSRNNVKLVDDGQAVSIPNTHEEIFEDDDEKYFIFATGAMVGSLVEETENNINNTTNKSNIRTFLELVGVLGCASFVQKVIKNRF